MADSKPTWKFVVQAIRSDAPNVNMDFTVEQIPNSTVMAKDYPVVLSSPARMLASFLDGETQEEGQDQDT